MIGKITTGKSFYHCISYCLEDKINLSEEQKKKMAEQDHLQHKERAEVLIYNNCFGNARELANQFNDVRKLSSRVEKPVLHISLRLAPGETLTKDHLSEIGRACAEEFKFEKNQYLCILHKDTREQHIHIVANRVGYDGKAASLSNNYQRIANFCRKMEKAYDLKQVLNPRAFMSKEERLIPRIDSRKGLLRNSIRNTVHKSRNYAEFELKMKALGYQILKGRGIAFIDDKKVKMKGSEVGFSLMKIERILAYNHQLGIRKATQNIKEQIVQIQQRNTGVKSPSQSHALTKSQSKAKHTSQAVHNDFKKDINDLAKELLTPIKESNHVNIELLQKKRKRKKQLRLHL